MSLRRVIVLLALAGLAALIFWPRGGPTIESGSILVVELSGAYTETADSGLPADLFQGQIPQPHRRLFDVDRQIPAGLSELGAVG